MKLLSTFGSQYFKCHVVQRMNLLESTIITKFYEGYKDMVLKFSKSTTHPGKAKWLSLLNEVNTQHVILVKSAPPLQCKIQQEA